MDELLYTLETKIKLLMTEKHKLDQSNLDLHQGKIDLLLDKEQLLAKHRKAILQLEELMQSLIAKIDNLENIK